MSRWLDQFKNHSFQREWSELNKRLISTRIDDETVITDLNELVRLKKVTAYIDKIVNSIDPELVPLVTWDNFSSQSLMLSQYIDDFQISRNILSIQNANGCADNLLTYVRPYMIYPDEVLVSNRKAVEAYTIEVDAYISKFKSNADLMSEGIEGAKIKSMDDLLSINAAKEKINSFFLELIGSSVSDDSIQKKINETYNNLEDKKTEINDFYNETIVGTDESPSTKKYISESKKVIQNFKSEAASIVESTEKEVSELRKFYSKIFGGSSDVHEGKLGLAAELELKVKALDDFESVQKNKYATLNSQIESLLPGAASAGLASSYKTMKDSFNSPINKMSTLFYVAVSILALSSFLLTIQKIGWFYIDFHAIKSWDDISRSLLNKLPIYAPILWLAFYASKRRSEYQRLQQEYAHKEALASSYESYKKQIHDLDSEDKEMQKAFIVKAIDAIAYNASITLDSNHGDKFPIHDLIEGITAKVTDVINK